MFGFPGLPTNLWGHGPSPDHAPETHDRATARAGAPLHHEPTLSPISRMQQTLGDMTRGLAQEGAAGQADMAGMLDRQRAQHELSERFQVVGDDFRGRRTANMVSQAEYERICHTFSDIRLGRGDLTIDSTMMTNPAQATAYREGALANIADMMMTEGGRRQIETMNHNVSRDDNGNARHGLNGQTMQLPGGLDQLLPEVHRHTTIRPFFRDANGDGNLTNDPTTAASYDNTNAMADARGASGDTPTGVINASGRNRWGRVGGRGGQRGEGTDSTIWWNPTFTNGSDDRADIALAHEMQHSLHETQGTLAAGTHRVRSSRDFRENNFERQAVGLENAGDNRRDPTGLTENEYRRERNALGIRGEHRFRQRHAYNEPYPR